MLLRRQNTWGVVTGLLLAVVVGSGVAAQACTHRPEGCSSTECEQTTECAHGTCSEDGASCLCAPCYEGASCAQYVDKYPAQFPNEKDSVAISTHHQGPVFRASVTDKDVSITCPKIAGGLSPEKCPCGLNAFVLIAASYEDDKVFFIDPETGLISVGPDSKLIPYNIYSMQIVARNGDSESRMNFTVNIESEAEGMPEHSSMSHFSHGEHQMDETEDEEITFKAQAQNAASNLSRKKRSAAVGSGPAASTMTLTNTVPVVDPTDLYPGQTVTYEVDIVLPNLVAGSEMDLLVEIFVMDAVSGITPMVLCSVEITAIGTSITSDGTTALDMAALNTAIDLRKNTFLPDITDRAIIDFGTVANSETDDAAGSFGPSTITIEFSASLIQNLDYTNSSVFVTVGAEYDSTNYVWVSQAEYNFDMQPSYAYPSDIVTTGQDSVAMYSGATFTITAKITDPVGPFLLEVYTPMDEHNKFTVSGLAINSIGVNMKCTGDPKVSYEYYYSVNKRTYYRAQATFDMMMTNLEYPNLFNKLSDPGNMIEMSYTVFFTEAQESEIISVAAGLYIGTTTLFTSVANITIGAAGADPPPPSAATYTKTEIGENRVVGQFSTLTWGIEIAVPTGANSLVDCTVTPDANHFVSVVWGSSGGNIALRPPLTDEGVVTYDTVTKSVLKVTFNINSTGFITGNSAADVAVLEFSVTYLTATPSDATIDCDGAIALDGAIAGAIGTVDMSGTADPPSADTDFFLGSQQALIAKLTFPAGGVPYSSLELEANGDFDVTTFNAEICDVRILKAGKAVPGLAGPLAELNKAFVYEKSDTTKLYNDAAKLTVGAMSGADRGSQLAAGDEDVVIRVTYHIPKNETVAGETYNVSLGLLFDTSLIWTGWIGLTADAGPPTVAPTIAPIIEFMPLDITDIVAGVPSLFKIKLKMSTGSVDVIKLVVSLASTATLSICRIMILDVGDSYPCVDKDPYGKELLFAGQPTTIIHDPDWGLSAALDLGTLRNVGHQEYYADGIADSDSILVGVIVRGIVAGGPEAINVAVEHLGGPTTLIMNYTVTGALVPANPLPSGSAVFVAEDGTANAFDGVMKVIDLVIHFPVDYSNSLRVNIINEDPLGMKLCIAAVAVVGKNLPCVIPHMILPFPDFTDTLETISLLLNETCYYEIVPDSIVESSLSIRVGVQLSKGSTAGTLSATIFENDVENAIVAITPFAVASGGAFDPTTINTTTEGFVVTLVDNTTELTFPGNSLFYGINIEIPPHTTGPIEIGTMTPTDSGRAYATTHSLRWSGVVGKNIGCPMDIELNYEVNLLQNSSFTLPMIHESQTDTLVGNLGYFTNLGIGYLQNFLTLPDDNVIGLEIEVMMADHINATDGIIVPISIAVKFGDVIYVVTKNLQLVRDPLLDLMMLRTEVFLSDPTVVQPFGQMSKIPITLRMSHFMNESRQEANDVMIRVMLPRPVQFVDLSDTETCNITNYNFTNNHYLDFDIDNLFFTDYVEINLTVTVDPNNDMIKGLGVIDAAALVRLVCTTYVAQVTPRYCGTSAVLPFQIDGTECFDDLGISGFPDCQFSASTAIEVASGPAFSHATGWSPAARSGPGWSHHITIDFLKKTRVTKITFTNVAGKKAVSTFRVSYSNDGFAYTDPCGLTEIAVTAGVALMPDECKFEARFGRLTIVDNVPDTQAFGVQFAWFGCPIDTVDDVCSTLPTVFTDSPGWRQIGYDATNLVFYFCDYSPTKGKNVCFSTVDSLTWNAMPAYIGSLVGLDAATAMFYAKDHKMSAAVSSVDGVNWMVVDGTVADGLTVTAKDVPGYASGFTAIEDDPYSADFTGIKFGGSYVAKWESCCS